MEKLEPIKCDFCKNHLSDGFVSFCDEEVWSIMPPVAEDVENCELFQGVEE